MHVAPSANPAASSRNNLSKYLTFRLADEEYAAAVLDVREIVGCMQITRVPHTPAHVRGVINLRGKIIPVVSLRERFGLPAVPDTAHTCIVVVQLHAEKTPVTLGFVVDAVQEVLDIPDAAIEPPPAVGFAGATEFLLGLGKLGSRVLIVLALERLLDAGELLRLHAATR